MEKKIPILGLASGFLNGLFGAGGGVITVFLLRKMGLETKKAHATSLSIILPLTIVSGIVYFFQGNLNVPDAAVFLPGAIIGGYLGGKFMTRIPDQILRKVFAGLIIFSGVRLLLR